MFYNNPDFSFSLTNVFHVQRTTETASCVSSKWTAISLRLHGSASFESENHSFLAQPGDIVYLPEGCSFKRISSNEELIVIHLKCHNEEDNQIQLFPASDLPRMSDFFSRILKTWEQSAPGYRHQCAALLHQMFAEMEAFTWNNSLSKQERIIKNSLMYMNMHYSDPNLNMYDVARQSNISEVYFRKVYKEIFGICPSHAIQNLRIEQAKELLQSGYFSISEVAEQCGFENCKYFSTLFRRLTGLSPSEYIKVTATR